MNDVIAHIHGLACPPVLDVRGEWVHCQNLKAASTSINDGPLRPRAIVRNRGRRNYERVWHQVIVPNWENLFLFTVVRNPWDRVLSAFVRCQAGGVHPNNRIAKNWTFWGYVRNVLDAVGPSINVHFAPQYDAVRHQGAPIPGMFVARFENLEKDWRMIARRLGLRERLARRNASRHRPYADYYDNETREIIERLYRPEIEALGYEFGQ